MRVPWSCLFATGLLQICTRRLPCSSLLMTMPLALVWLRILTWLLIGAIFWNEAWPLDWLDVLALGSLLLVWFDAWLRAFDLDIRFEALDLNILTVSRFYCLPFWYSDTLVQSGLLVQKRLNVDLWMSWLLTWCRFCTATSYLIDIFVAVRTLNLDSDWCTSILVEAFLLSFRTLVDCFWQWLCATLIFAFWIRNHGLCTVTSVTPPQLE